MVGSDYRDFDEEVSCRYQFRAARERGGFLWSTTASLIPALHVLHKRIPLANYRSA